MPGRPTSERKGPFANRVRELRVQAGLTQEDLAARFDVTTSAIGKLERGDRRLRNDQITKLSRIFACHPIELLLPLSPEEREALKIVGAASSAQRSRMIQMLRMLAEPLASESDRAA